MYSYSTCSSCLYVLLADRVSKDDYNRLMSRANDAKKRLEDAEKRVTDSDRKLRILEKAKDKAEAELNATKADLIACKVANDEYFEAEKAHQEELSKATEGLTEFQDELLSKYSETFHLT